MSDLILASASPRRRQILEAAGIPFTMKTAQIDEQQQLLDLAGVERVGTGLLRLPESLPAEQAALLLAEAKARDVCLRLNDESSAIQVLAADTIVVCKGILFGKPEDAASATEMLRLLSGQSHTVITAHVLIERRRAGAELTVKSMAVRTDVTFRRLEVEEIERYVATGEPFDKAGAYAIQGEGAVLVSHIKGDYLNVIGLSLDAVQYLLGRSQFLFVYGTLMSDQEAHAMLIGRSTFWGHGMIQGVLFDLKEYPAAVKSETNSISGELYRVNDPALFAELDEYEECNTAEPEHDLFRRKTIEVRLDSGERINAHAYFIIKLPEDALNIPEGIYQTGLCKEDG